MERRILIGSIIAVAILVLVSFTGVVGFQSVKSDVKASPLFSIRSKRAIDEETEDFTCDYVGKGKTTPITIPRRDDRTVLAQKIIEGISKMNDNTFNKFVELVTSYLQKKNRNTDINIIQGLQFIRKNPNEAKNLAINGAREDTVDFPCTIDGKLGPIRCLLFYLVDSIIFSFIIILIIMGSLIMALYMVLFPTQWLTCRYIPHFCFDYV